MSVRLVEDGDLDPRLFGCCDNPGLDPVQCPSCGHLMVLCNECDTLFPNLEQLETVQRKSDNPAIACSACQYDFGTAPLGASNAQVAWDDWTASWTGRRLVNCYPFPPAWLAGELPDIRTCDATYCTYHYRSLPPIPDSLRDESFAFIRSLPLAETHGARWSSSQFAAQSVYDVERSTLEDLVKQAGYELPASFLNFLFNRDILTRLRSPTDCDYSCSARLIPCGGPLGGHFLQFLSDSQDCVHWYLYLHPQFGGCVVYSEDLSTEGALSDPNAAASRIRFCAETFLEFATRTWLEDELWFRHKEAQPLTPEMQQYMQHYASGLDGFWSWDEDEW